MVTGLLLCLSLGGQRSGWETVDGIGVIKIRRSQAGKIF